MPDNNLHQCGSYTGVYERTNKSTRSRDRKVVHFACGKSTCPYCQERRRKKLIRRLRGVQWKGTLYFWTITTDPKVISREEATKTVNHRWHTVHRSLIRINPKLKYFRVVEFTKSGLPHIHLLTNSWIDWHEFRRLLIQGQFGQVLHFERIPAQRAINYLCKYVAKGVYGVAQALRYRLRLWAQSRKLLPNTLYIDPEGSWTLLYVFPWGNRSGFEGSIRTPCLSPDY